MKHKIKIIIEKILYVFFATDLNKIYDKISKYDVVSFDIFDTLVKRNIDNPTSIFDIVEKKYNSTNKNKIFDFKKNRIIAEKLALRKSNYEETTLDEIYNEMKMFDSKQIIQLKQIEIETEIESIFANEEIFNVYKFCIDNNKTIIITSDMYLDIKTISEILKLNGFEKYDKLYLSSDKKVCKKTGNIFKLIKDEFENKKILHIGDHPISDFIRPKQNGIDSILIKK